MCIEQGTTGWKFASYAQKEEEIREIEVSILQRLRPLIYTFFFSFFPQAKVDYGNAAVYWCHKAIEI